MRRKFWVPIVSGAVLAGGVSVAYYLAADNSEGKVHEVAEVSNRQPVAAKRDGGHDGSGLPIAASAASGVSVSNATVRQPRLAPRRAVEVAQQSGLSNDALVAAREIQMCEILAGRSQKLLEYVAERGIQTRKPLSEIVAPLEAQERMCQELDASMMRQYEPMLRRAMEGGERGAAALWWLTPEARALNNVDGETAALDLLRRDATQCDRESIGTYKVTALRFPKVFDKTEVAAVHAASAQLVKDHKVKRDRLEELLKTFHPLYNTELGVDQNLKRAKMAEILNWCAQNLMPSRT